MYFDSEVGSIIKSRNEETLLQEQKQRRTSWLSCSMLQGERRLDLEDLPDAKDRPNSFDDMKLHETTCR
jgi:hypothetical protein